MQARTAFGSDACQRCHVVPMCSSRQLGHPIPPVSRSRPTSITTKQSRAPPASQDARSDGVQRSALHRGRPAPPGRLQQPAQPGVHGPEAGVQQPPAAARRRRRRRSAGGGQPAACGRRTQQVRCRWVLACRCPHAAPATGSWLWIARRSQTCCCPPSRYEAAERGEFGVGTALQFGEADVKGQDFSKQDLQRSNFTAADVSALPLPAAPAAGCWLLTLTLLEQGAAWQPPLPTIAAPCTHPAPRLLLPHPAVPGLQLFWLQPGCRLLHEERAATHQLRGGLQGVCWWA